MIGYLYKYRRFATALDVGALVDHACAYMESKQEFSSEHEIFCFIALHDLLSPEKATSIEPRLREAVLSLVRINPQDWADYVPRPHHFAQTPSHASLFGLDDDAMEPDLGQLATVIQQDGGLWPVWHLGTN